FITAVIVTVKTHKPTNKSNLAQMNCASLKLNLSA
ncbi:MAG: hypothetical protein ACI910_003343, partial [Oleispira sp.]